jgi:hypothetical protein
MPRINPTPVVRLLVVVAFAALCLTSSWFDIRAKGTFTEGIEREPTLWANYTIDGQDEVIQLEISNSTPLIVYWSERETITGSGSSNSSESPSGDDTQAEAKQDDGYLNLGRARNIVKTMVVLCCLLELLCVVRPMKITRGLAIGFWFAGFFALTILVPVSLVSDSFGGGGQAGSGAQPGDGFDTGEESGAVQFAHSTFESNLNIHFTAIVWSFDSSGYDLGLVEEQDRDSVRQSPPDEGEPGEDSFIRFAGDIRIVISDGVWIWLAIPFFWISITILATMSTRLLVEVGGSDSDEGTSDEPEPEANHRKDAGGPDSSPLEDSILTEHFVSVPDSQDDIE